MIRGTDSKSHEQIADYLDGTGTTLPPPNPATIPFSFPWPCMKDRTRSLRTFRGSRPCIPASASAIELGQIRPAGVPPPPMKPCRRLDQLKPKGQSPPDPITPTSPYQRLLPVKAPPASSKNSRPKRSSPTIENFFLDPQKIVRRHLHGDIDDAARPPSLWAAPFEAIPQHRALYSPYHPRDPTRTAKPIIKKTDRDSATIMLAYPPGTWLSTLPTATP